MRCATQLKSDVPESRFPIQVLLGKVRSIEAGKVLIAKLEIKDLRIGLGRSYFLRASRNSRTLPSKSISEENSPYWATLEQGVLECPGIAVPFSMFRSSRDCWPKGCG